MKGFVMAVPWSVCRRRSTSGAVNVAREPESVKGLRPSGSLLVVRARSRARRVPRIRRFVLRAP